MNYIIFIAVLFYLLIGVRFMVRLFVVVAQLSPEVHSMLGEKVVCGSVSPHSYRVQLFPHTCTVCNCLLTLVQCATVCHTCTVCICLPHLYLVDLFPHTCTVCSCFPTLVTCATVYPHLYRVQLFSHTCT